MARRLFELQAARRRNGDLANGAIYVVYSDEAGTLPADIAASVDGSSISGSVVTTADISGLGPGSSRFYGPSSGVDTLYIRSSSDATLGVQKIRSDSDERIDALETGAVGHPNLGVHNVMGLATDAELVAHDIDTVTVHGIADTSKVALKPGAADLILYVSTVGDDSNDGLSPGNAKLGIQAALTALGTSGGQVNILGGTHDLTAELIVNSTANPVVLRGLGSGIVGSVTTLRWLTDLGVGKFGIKNVNNAATSRIRIENLRLTGPTLSMPLGWAGGCEMRGIRLNRRMEVRDCWIRGFHSGINIVQDHNRVERTEIADCKYGIYWSDMTQYGDHWLIDNNLTDNKFASLAIATNGQMLGTTIEHGHLGVSPYALYIEAGRGNVDCFSKVTMTQVSIEWCGNGVIFSPDLTAKSLYVTMINCYMSNDPAYGLSGVAHIAPIVLGTMYGWVVINPVGPGIDPAVLPTEASFVKANTFQRNLFIGPDWASIFADKESAGAPELFVVNAGTSCVGNRWQDGSKRGTIARAHSSLGAVTKGLVLAAQQNDQVGPMAASYTANPLVELAGVAMNAAPSNATALQAAVIVAQEGMNILTQVTATPSSGARVMVDPANRDKGVADDGRLDTQHLGQMSASQTGATAGATAVLDLHLSRTQTVQRKTVTGSRGGNAALASLLTQLAAQGLITDSSSA